METILWLLHVADLNENKLILGFYYCGIDEYGATINYVGEVRHNSFFSHLFDAKKSLCESRRRRRGGHFAI